MKNTLRLLACLCACLATPSAAVEVSARLSGIVDNREYHSDNRLSQTFFGARGAATVSQEFSQYHVMAGGIAYYKEFGDAAWHVPEPILYYQFHSQHTLFRMGSFTRKDVLTVPECLLADSFCISRPNLEGGYLERQSGRFVRSAWLDWTGRLADSVRESFLLGMGTSWDGDHVQLAGDMLYRHNAHQGLRLPGESIIDDGGLRAAVSVPVAISFIDSFNINASGLMVYHRDRGAGSSWNTPVGAQLGLTATKGHLGAALSYWHGIYKDEGYTSTVFGDQIYAHSEFASADLFYRFQERGPVTMRFDLFLDVADNKLDVRQKFALEALIGYRHKPAAGENASSWFGIIER